VPRVDDGYGWATPRDFLEYSVWRHRHDQHARPAGTALTTPATSATSAADTDSADAANADAARAADADAARAALTQLPWWYPCEVHDALPLLPTYRLQGLHRQLRQEMPTVRLFATKSELRQTDGMKCGVSRRVRKCITPFFSYRRRTKRTSQRRKHPG
jgi:hypothetical protein